MLSTLLSWSFYIQNNHNQKKKERKKKEKYSLVVSWISLWGMSKVHWLDKKNNVYIFCRGLLPSNAVTLHENKKSFGGGGGGDCFCCLGLNFFSFCLFRWKSTVLFCSSKWHYLCVHFLWLTLFYSPHADSQLTLFYSPHADSQLTLFYSPHADSQLCFILFIKTQKCWTLSNQPFCVLSFVVISALL